MWFSSTASQGSYSHLFWWWTTNNIATERYTEVVQLLLCHQSHLHMLFPTSKWLIFPVLVIVFEGFILETERPILRFVAFTFCTSVSFTSMIPTQTQRLSYLLLLSFGLTEIIVLTHDTSFFVLMTLVVLDTKRVWFRWEDNLLLQKVSLSSERMRGIDSLETQNVSCEEKKMKELSFFRLSLQFMTNSSIPQKCRKRPLFSWKSVKNKGKFSKSFLPIDV